MVLPRVVATIVFVLPLTNLGKGEIITEPAVELRWDFSSCGKVGRYGPSQELCDNSYRETNLEGDVSVEYGIQTWVVPISGLYLITARSPSGSMDINRDAGRGALLSGEFQLEKGDVLRILVGQHGVSTDPSRINKPLGGSGGTFVVSGNSILLIAGGASCGSGTNWNVTSATADANLIRDGHNASIMGGGIGLGGIDGLGGGPGDISSDIDRGAGGGSGYNGDGDIGLGNFDRDVKQRVSKSFTSDGHHVDKGPAVGGYFRYTENDRKIENNGGFGGGGSGSGNGGCGGGGGYSGGGGGTLNGWGGGGGSINNGNRQHNLYSRDGSGAVLISFIGHQCCGPIAAYIAMTFVAGVLVTVIVGYVIMRILSSLSETEDGSESSCSRCLKKLRLKSSEEHNPPKTKSRSR